MWIESEDNQAHKPASMCDVSFRIECVGLPVDHSSKLARSLCEQQSWLQNLPGTGIHPIHVAGSQNGWQRPDGSDQLLLLSRRTRLRIRIDSNHADRLIESLQGTTHHIDAQPLKILGGRVNILQPMTTLFSRYTVYLDDQDSDADENAEANENTLMQRVIGNCKQLGYQPSKILCGKSTRLATSNGPIAVRSLLLADVPTEYSLPLQDAGLGDLRLMGCGILIPHKDTAAVN